VLNKTKLLNTFLLFFYLLNFSACATGSDTQKQESFFYEERVIIPKYNPNDFTHVLITPSNGKWNRYVLNDPNKKHFYVKPGKYSSKYINLTRSGTKSSRRTMSLYNGNDLHPAALPDNQVANVLFHFDGADYWTIDRMANLDRNVNPSMRLMNGASHNIINRWHLRNYKYGISIYSYCHYNTVQNSYINHATEAARRVMDSVGLNIHTNGKSVGEAIGTKFINNDIRNATDGIQITRSKGKGSNNANFEGTIINNNRIWMDKTTYIDAKGKLNPSGSYFYGENAIDLKAGSENPKNPVIVTNNIIWGYSKTDLRSLKAGKPFTSHYGVKNLKMNRNIITDCKIGPVIISAEDWEFKNNIIHNIYTVRGQSMLYLSENQRVKVENNTFVNDVINRNGWSLYIHQLATNDSIKSNVFINTPRAGGVTKGHIFDNNWFYNSKESLPNNNEHHPSIKQAQMDNYIFTYERFTNKLKTKELKNVVSTNLSEHHDDQAGSFLRREMRASSIFIKGNITILPESVIMLLL